jgi:hypothetical protein
MNAALKLLADGMVYATFVGAVLFVAVYLRRNWRSSAVGRNVMIFMVVIALVSGLAVSTLIFGREWPLRDLIRAVAWGMVAGVIWWRNALLLRTPRPAPRPGADDDQPIGERSPAVPDRRDRP